MGRITAVLLSLLLLAGCKEALYSKMTLVEANEMVAVLQAAGISVSRTEDKDGLFAVNVSKNNVGAAFVMLKSEGLPREKFDNIGQVFESRNIVGTPFEEKARYSYALSQELSRTISEIAEVESARVHVVLPDEPRFNQEPEGASASVVIYHTANMQAEENASKIKSILAHAVPDLRYDRISLAFFQKPELSVVKQVPQGPVAAANAASSITSLESRLPLPGADIWIIGNLLILLVLGGLVLRMLGVRRRNRGS